MADKKEIVYALCLCFGVSSSACSTAKITLLSSPSQAEVYVAALGDRKAKLVGETPIKMTSTDLSKAYGGAGPITLEFKKDGYSTVKTIVTDIGAIDLTINMDLPPSSGLEDQVRLNLVVDSIFESQRLAKVGRGDDALIRLKALEKEAPHLAATYELEGGIYYLQKKYKEALDAYTLASNYNPKNPQVLRMRNYLEVSLGVRKREISEPGPFDKITENEHPSSTVSASDSLIPPAGANVPTSDQTKLPAEKGGK
jgi:tetratricopeptide (TPR) repeat protein